jgi:hypothetical protein
MTPGLPLGPQPSNAFALIPGLPSFWLATLQCLCLDSWACFLLARNLATPCLGREPKARVATNTINFTVSLYTLVTMTIYHPILHGCVKLLFPVLFDEWLTLAIPFPTTFPLNLGWKMRHFVPTFNGTYHHTFKQHVCVCNMNYE